MRTLTFVLPMPPNLANGRMHWRTKHRRQNAWRTNAVILERELGRHITEPPIARALVTAVLYPHQRMDDDNAVARLKWPLDLLVRCGILVSDKRPDCALTGIPEQHIDRKNPRVVLIVVEVA